MDNYPMISKSDLEKAPFNEQEIPEKTFEVTCLQTLSRTATVTTRNYIPGNCGVDYEDDGEGGYYKSFYEDAPDTTDTNWSDEWHENDHYTPIQLIRLLKGYIEKDLLYGDRVYSESHLKHLLQECEGWIEDNVEYITN